MSAEPNSFHGDSLELARQIDSLCDEFERLCIAGEHPRIEAFLERIGEKRRLLTELIPIEAHYRRSRGESPKLAEYQLRFPGLPLTALEASFESKVEVRKPFSPRTLAIDQPTLDAQEQPQTTARNVVRYFGDYELLDVIARGGMGVVYKARQISLNRIVALKMILSGELASQREIDRFYSEAKAAALLDHPGIVPIYEVGEHEGKHFFSMTYVEGKSLADQINEHPVEPIAAAKLMLVVAQSVQFAHEHGVIHRDLKPSNILLDLRGRPRVTDFGLAKRLSDDSGLTVSGDVLGTPSYMPPEQASGQIDTVGPISDVYSLGAILYSMITGRPPFQAASSMDTMRQVVERDPLSPRQLNPAVPRDLETIVLKCLEKSVSRRYNSAQTLAEELQRFIEGRPIVARPIGRVAKAWRWCRRNPMPASMVSAVAVTMLVATIVSVNSARNEGLANKALDREHKEGLVQLAKSHASKANALRMSGRPGQRFGALSAIRESMRITGPTRELADVAAAALCLPDCEVDFEWDGFPEGSRRVVLSPTFDRYARADDTGVISIRSLPQDEEISRIKIDGVFRDYGALRFSQDGRLLFECYDRPKRARAWLITDKQPKLIADESSSWVETLDGRQVLIAKGSQLLIIDSTGEKPTRSIPIGQDITESFFSGQFGQSKLVISFGSSWKTVDLQSGVITPAFPQARELACWPAPHANGQWAVWSTNNPVGGILVDTQTGEQLAPPFEGHKTHGIVPFLSRYGDAAFSSDWHGILRMWDPRSGRLLFNRTSADSNNWQVVSSDNQLIGPETVGTQVRWLRFASGREFSHVAASITPNDSVVYSEASSLSPDGRLLAFGAKSGLVLCDTLSGLPLLRVTNRTLDEDNVVGFLDDGSLLTSEGYRIVRRSIKRDSNGTLNVGLPTIQSNAQTPKGLLVRSAASKDGSVMAVPVGRAGVVCVRTKLTPLELELATSSDIRCVSVSPNGEYLAAGLHTADPGKTSLCAYVWETASGKLVAELETRSLCSVSFSPLGRYLTVTSGEVNECRVFEVGSWRLVDKFAAKYPGVFSPDESLFAIAMNPGEVSLLHGSDLTEFAKLSSPNENAYRPLALMPDNSRLYACNVETEQMCVWNLALIRRGLDELKLARDWPEISLASSPEVAPPSLKTIIEAPARVPSQPQPTASPTGVQLVDQVRQTGWSIVLALLPKLESAEQNSFPGIHQFTDDVRRLEKCIDTAKPPHEWKTIDADTLLHRNPHFWNAYYEVSPHELTFAVLHIGLLATCGELEQAHNLIHLLMLDSELVQPHQEQLRPLDRLLHLMLRDSGSMMKKGINYHDAAEYENAINTFNMALEIWPQNAAAHYELGFTKSALNDQSADLHFANSRHYDPLRRESIPAGLLSLLPPACRHANEAKKLWNSILLTKASVPNSSLKALSEHCQVAAPVELRFHELALAFRQVVIAKNRRYTDEDKAFISTSLRQLVETTDIERAMKRLDSEVNTLFAITETQNPEASP